MAAEDTTSAKLGNAKTIKFQFGARETRSNAHERVANGDVSVTPRVRLHLGSQHDKVRGRSDKYLACKRKTKVLEKWRFISQHSFVLAR